MFSSEVSMQSCVLSFILFCWGSVRKYCFYWFKPPCGECHSLIVLAAVEHLPTYTGCNTLATCRFPAQYSISLVGVTSCISMLGLFTDDCFWFLIFLSAGSQALLSWSPMSRFNRFSSVVVIAIASNVKLS